MSEEMVIAIVAAGAVLCGAIIAVVASLITALLAQRTAREDRRQTIAAESVRWEESQEAARSTWLRDQRQEAYAQYLSDADDVFRTSVNMYLSSEQTMPAQQGEGLTASYGAAGKALNQLRILDASGQEAANDDMGALAALVDVAVKSKALSPEDAEAQWEEAQDKRQDARAELLRCAREDLGTGRLDGDQSALTS